VTKSRIADRGARALLTALAACASASPARDPDGGAIDGDGSAGKEPGEPFADNVCFQCALRNCSVPADACAQYATCAPWLACVSACPTNDTGVAAEASCVRRCGLPVAAEVLYICIQQFANGFFPGCEDACEPL
jgi:hypothetical protein